METETTTLVVYAEPLITKSGTNAVRPEQRRQKMTLGVAIAAPFLENFGRGTRDGRQPMVTRMFDFVSNPVEATTGNRHGVSQIATQDLSLSTNGRVPPIDDVG